MILCILSICLSIGLIYLRVRARTTGIPIFSSFYIVNSKMFGEPMDVRSWITPNEPAIKEVAKEFQTGEKIATVTKAYNWLEETYHYDIDDWIILNNGRIIIKGGTDSWALPVFTLAQKHQNGNIYVDCEDGTFILVSLLRSLGIEAYANIGTVTITDPETKQSSIYGHAWGTVIIDGKEYLLETTLGDPLKELRPVPDNELLKYKTDVKFNERDVIAITGVDINKEIYPPLPPAKIQDLKDALNSAN
jgi:transglutaminase-like putative cysteine protease